MLAATEESEVVSQTRRGSGSGPEVEGPPRPAPMHEAGLPELLVEHPPGDAPRNRRRWPFFLMLVCWVCLGAAAAIFRDPIVGYVDRTPPTETATVELRPAVFALGRLEPLGEVLSIAAPEGSTAAGLKRLEVRENETVAAGAVLAVLDNEDRLRAAVEVAAESVEQAGSQLRQTEVLVESTRAELEARLRADEAAAATAREKLERQLKLARTAATTQEELDEARLLEETSRQAVLETRSKLKRYDATDGDAADVAVARQAVSLAEASLAEARARLELAYVRSPIDGEVLDIHVRPGEPVGQEPILDMGATQVMMARVEVYESDAGLVEVGQKVRLSSPALPEPLMGRVEQIGSVVRRQSVVRSDPAANTDARVIEVLVRLDPGSSEAARRLVNLQITAEIRL